MSLRRQKPFRRGLQNTFPNRSLVALTASMENMITASHTKLLAVLYIRVHKFFTKELALSLDEC